VQKHSKNNISTFFSESRQQNKAGVEGTRVQG
jgi:hypothetical protein